jgi:hypothetical protein
MIDRTLRINYNMNKNGRIAEELGSLSSLAATVFSSFLSGPEF